MFSLEKYLLGSSVHFSISLCGCFVWSFFAVVLSFILPTELYEFFIYFGILAPYQIHDLQVFSPILWSMLIFAKRNTERTYQKLRKMTSNEVQGRHRKQDWISLRFNFWNMLIFYRSKNVIKSIETEKFSPDPFTQKLMNLTMYQIDNIINRRNKMTLRKLRPLSGK